MNCVQLTGRITADPELRRTGDGTAVCSYSLAVKRPMVKDKTDFIGCVTWRQGAEYLCQYAHKGDVLAVTGSLQSREWTDKQGNKRTAWEVVTDSVELLSRRKQQEGSNAPGSQNGYPGGAGGGQSGYGQSYYAQQGFGGYGLIEGEDKDLPF